MAMTNPQSEKDELVVASGYMTAYTGNSRVSSYINTALGRELGGKGSKVKVVKLSNVTIRDYTGTVITEEVADDAVYLEVTEAKYFSVDQDKVQAAHGAGGYLSALGSQAGAQVSDVVDAFTLATLESDGTPLAVGGTPVEFDVETSGNIYAVLLQGRTALAGKGNKADRVAFVPSVAIPNLLNDTHFVAAGSDALIEAEVGKAAGFRIVEIEDPAFTSIVLVGDRDAAASVVTLNDVNTTWTPSPFKNCVSGLTCFGADVLRDEAVIVIPAAS